MIVGETSKYFKTNRGLNLFLSDIRRIPLLSVQEEEDLVLEAKKGSMAAKDKLISGNLRFIYSLAKIYARTDEELMDYVDEGVIGLEEALKAFDPTRGYKFITYGVWYIRRSMNYYLMTMRDSVSRSAPVGQMAKKVDVIRQKYFAENGRLPNEEEIKHILKESFNIAPKNDEYLFDNSTVSINEEMSDDYSVEESSEYNEITASKNEYEDEIEREDTNSELEAALSVLTPEEADIVRMRFGVGIYSDRPRSDEEISDKYHVNASRINRIVENSLEYVRQNYEKRAV